MAADASRDQAPLALSSFPTSHYFPFNPPVQISCSSQQESYPEECLCGLTSNHGHWQNPLSAAPMTDDNSTSRLLHEK